MVSLLIAWLAWSSVRLSVVVGENDAILHVTTYNEAEARWLLNIAAGAYSSNPELCVNKTMPRDEQWYIYNTNNLVCDQVESTCSSYTIRSDVVRQIIVSFRGTKTKKQLFVEGWQSLKPGENFAGKGLVNRYFLHALDVIWPNIGPMLSDPMLSSYTVTFTGHSLGAALASLAAARTVLQNLRTGDQIKLVTYGQPRVGDIEFAQFHDKMLPYSFRLVHRMDIVPHMPSCEKNTSSPDADDSKSKPCSRADDGEPYHHGTEIWYPNGMGTGAQYYECLGGPEDEDFDCSDSLVFKMNKYKTYISDHRHYFDVRVPTYGKHGCVNVTVSEQDDNDSAAPSFTNESVSPFQQLRSTISNLFGKIFNYFKR